MTDEEEIKKLIQTLGGYKPGKPLKHFITHATFPRFKNLEEGTTVTFDFPVTALVGANGIGKSSMLHALWGMPRGYSTSKFWFATELDPIAHTQKDPQRYFYGYWDDDVGGIVETRKARLGRKKGADYWEPYRWSGRDGMKPLPQGTYPGKAKDRWMPVNREVVYINMKATFGSFDRYFYFDEGLNGGAKGEVMQREARRLKAIKELNRTSYKLGGIERVFENRDLSLDELQAVSNILGRDYQSARLIRHSLFPGNRGRDLSVVFRRGAEYSEAFAGSGEIAAVNAVVQILAANDYSLVLLDEPETSLHPGAQRALLRFLLDQVKLRKHQVVLSTHSSEFVTGLPFRAVKVFEENGKSRSRVLPQSSPSAAFLRLGKTPPDKRRVLVEDELAEMLVHHACKALDPGDAKALDVKVAPGGAESILKYLGPAAMVSHDDVYVLLDGDKRRVPSFTDPDSVPPGKYPSLGQVLKAELGFDPLFHIPGGDPAAHSVAKKDAQLSYFAWLRKRVSYLPRGLPEHILLEALQPGQGHASTTPAATKAAFLTLVANGVQGLALTAAEVLALAKVKVALIPQNNADVLAIRTQLEAWLHG